MSPPDTRLSAHARGESRIAIFVLGMHRSGTSALTRTLSQCGYALPNTLLGGREDSNPLGHWESTKINEFDDELLGTAGLHWSHFTQLPTGWDSSPDHPIHVRRAAALLDEEYGEARMLVVKDPRICRVLPVWLSAAADFGANPHLVSLTRAPGEVAASLWARNGFAPAFGELLWLRYVIDAERDGRQTPRVHLTYDQVLEDWRAAIERIRTVLALPLPGLSHAMAAKADAFVSHKHRHQRNTSLASRGRLAEWINTVAEISERWAIAGENSRDHVTLDSIRADFDATMDVAGVALLIGFEGQTHARKLRSARNDAESRLEDAEAKLEAAEAAKSAITEQLEASAGTLDHTIRKLNRFRADAAAAGAEGQRLAGILDETNARLTEVEGTAAAHRKSVARLTAQKQAADAEGERLAEELRTVRRRAAKQDREHSEALQTSASALAVAHARIESITAALDGARGRGDELAIERRAALDDLVATRSDLATTIHEVANLRVELATTRAHLGHATASRDEATARRVEAEAHSAAAIDRLNAEHEDAMAALRQRLSIRRRLSRLVAPETTAALPSETRRHDDIELLRTSHWFDANHYRTTYADIAASGADPFAHYLDHGAQEGRDPGPAFSTNGYCLRYPDVAAEGFNPLVHFLRHGAPEGRVSVGPDEALLRSSHLFVASWYLETYPDIAAAGRDPFDHYLAEGASEGRNPGPEFSTAGYRHRHPDVAGTGENPLIHYLRHGEGEGRSIVGHDEAALRLSSLFDAAWYLERYPDIAEAGRDPYEHYLAEGASEGRDPGPDFSSIGYLNRYPDVAATGANPLVHYERYGAAEGRRPVTQAAATASEAIARVRASSWFDADWYLDRYADVRGNKDDPAEHYVLHGADEGRNPGPAFSTRRYLHAYADIVSNPLLHFIDYGEAEGRTAFAAGSYADANPESLVIESGLFDGDWYRARYLADLPAGMDPLRHYLDHGAATGNDPGPAFSHAGYRRAHPDVPADKDPLLFHLTRGIEEGRCIVSGAEQTAHAFASAVSVHPRFDFAGYGARAAEIFPDALAAARHYLDIGGPAGLDPSDAFHAAWYMRVNGDVKAGGLPAFVHYVLYGEAEGRAATATAPDYDAILLPAPVICADRSLVEDVDRRPVSVARWDFDFTNATPPDVSRGDADYAACVTMFGLLGGDRSTAVAADLAFPALTAPLDDANRLVADAWFVNPGQLRVRFDVMDPAAQTSATTIGAFQSVGGIVEPCGRSLIAGEGPVFVTLATVDSCSPILLVAISEESEKVTARLLPFPSLFRGGLHQAEAAANVAEGEDRLAQIEALSRGYLASLFDGGGAPFSVAGLAVEPAPSNGRPALTPNVRRWLDTVFGIGVDSEEGDRAPRRRRDHAETGAILSLPRQSVPTIAAVVSRGEWAVPPLGAMPPFLLADAAGGAPRLAIDWTAEATEALDMAQPSSRARAFPWLTVDGERGEPRREPERSAIIFASHNPSPTELIFPHSPEGHAPPMPRADAAPGALHVALRVTQPYPACLPVLRALGQQTLAGSLTLHLCPAEGLIVPDQLVDAAARLFPGRVVREGATPDSDALLLLQDTILLHDARTCEFLVTLLELPRVASAGCIEIVEHVGKRGTVTVDFAGFFDASEARVPAAPDIAKALPVTTYPVADMGRRLVMVRADVWHRAVGTLHHWPEHLCTYAQEVATAGLRHLMTSTLSATVLSPAEGQFRASHATMRASGPVVAELEA